MITHGIVQYIFYPALNYMDFIMEYMNTIYNDSSVLLMIMIFWS